jgi:hypothetical protein
MMHKWIVLKTILTCQSHFNVTFNANFKIVHQLVKKKTNFDNIKMDSMYVKKNFFLVLHNGQNSETK